MWEGESMTHSRVSFLFFSLVLSISTCFSSRLLAFSVESHLEERRCDPGIVWGTACVHLPPKAVNFPQLCTSAQLDLSQMPASELCPDNCWAAGYSGTRQIVSTPPDFAPPETCCWIVYTIDCWKWVEVIDPPHTPSVDLPPSEPK
jgi:hypothetical protein